MWTSRKNNDLISNGDLCTESYSDNSRRNRQTGRLKNVLQGVDRGKFGLKKPNA